MTHFYDTLSQIWDKIRGNKIVAQFDNGAELNVNRRLLDAVVVDPDGRQYTLGAYIRQFVDEQE